MTPNSDSNPAPDAADDIFVSTAELPRYQILSITPAERFCAVFRSGQKIRLACWVHLRDRQTQEDFITGAFSEQGAGARLILGISDPDLIRYAVV